MAAAEVGVATVEIAAEVVADIPKTKTYKIKTIRQLQIIKVKTKIKNLTKEAKRPVRMSQIMPALSTGRRAEMLRTVPIR